MFLYMTTTIGYLYVSREGVTNEVETANSTIKEYLVECFAKGLNYSAETYVTRISSNQSPCFASVYSNVLNRSIFINIQEFIDIVNEFMEEHYSGEQYTIHLSLRTDTITICRVQMSQCYMMK